MKISLVCLGIVLFSRLGFAGGSSDGKEETLIPASASTSGSNAVDPISKAFSNLELVKLIQLSMQSYINNKNFSHKVQIVYYVNGKPRLFPAQVNPPFVLLNQKDFVLDESGNIVLSSQEKLFTDIIK